MGIVSSLLSKSTNNMKFLLVIAVAAYAKAEAEAKPGFAYSIGHLPLAYTHAAPALTYAVPHVNPVVYTLGLPAAGCQNSEGAFVPCAQGSYFGYVPVAAAAAPVEAAPAVEAERKKREAEAEPTALAEAEAEADPAADPWLYYSGVYGGHLDYGGYSHYRPLTYSYAPYTYSHVYNHYGLGHYGLGYYGRKKREATAEPEATAAPEADPWLLYGGYGHGLGHGYGYAYAPYTYANYHHPLTYFYGGCRNNLGSVVPCAGR